MPIHPVFKTWASTGQTLGLTDRYKLIDVHDGDTPNIRMPIRMLSVDTPEVTARSSTGATNWDERLAQLAEWITDGKAPIDEELADTLLPKLVPGRAGTLQYEQGLQASTFNKENIARRLDRPGGRPRGLFVRTSHQPFDDNGRLLAYIAPDYTRDERENMTLEQRSTFNLDLIDSGWGAPFLIYPSLPKAADLELYVAAVQRAVGQNRGAWADPLYLPGYEYRMVEKLFQVTRRLESGEDLSDADRKGWRSRLCINMETRELHGPEAYAQIPHDRRLWVWPKEVDNARQDFDLINP